jgi:uncharacterized protein (DUF488 family)
VTVFTIGHSTRPIADFIALLTAAAVECVVDVRRFPGSRRQPQYNSEALARSLAAAGIEYRHMPALGGRRGARAGNEPSPHTLWREEGFRNYADYAETPEFRRAFAELLDLARRRSIAIMCAEAVWWRCHRRIIADYLLAAGIDVMHILDGKIEPARLTPDAVVRADGSLLYREPGLF